MVLTDKLDFTLTQLRIKLLHEEKSYLIKLMSSLRYLKEVYVLLAATILDRKTELISPVQFSQAQKAIEQKIFDVFTNLKPLYEEFLLLNDVNFTIFRNEYQNPLTALNGYSRLLLHTIVDPVVAKKNCPTAQQISQFVQIVIFMRNIRGYFLKKKVYVRETSFYFFDQEKIKGLTTQHYFIFDITLQQLPLIPTSDSLEFIFNQLLCNAVQFTPAGGTITISGRVTAGGVEITVSDSGIGLDKKHLELIFDQYYQVNPTNSPFWQEVNGEKLLLGLGLGVGLTACRQIVQAHNGRIWAESPGHDEEKLPGSQFHVFLPVLATRDFETPAEGYLLE